MRAAGQAPRQQAAAGPPAFVRDAADRHAAGAVRRVSGRPAEPRARPAEPGRTEPRVEPARRGPPEKAPTARGPIASGVRYGAQQERPVAPAPAAEPLSAPRGPTERGRASAHAGPAPEPAVPDAQVRRPADAAASDGRPVRPSRAAWGPGGPRAGRVPERPGLRVAPRAASAVRAGARAPREAQPVPAREGAGLSGEPQREPTARPGAEARAADWLATGPWGRRRRARQALRGRAARQARARGAAGRARRRRGPVVPERVRRKGGARSRERRSRPATGPRRGGWYRPEASSWYAS
ncbi:hypothetical protein C8D03_1468 [Bosea sp. 124]|nr:hypothetical protein C8D03_1468 [Bosea sp. 124]